MYMTIVYQLQLVYTVINCNVKIEKSPAEVQSSKLSCGTAALVNGYSKYRK